MIAPAPENSQRGKVSEDTKNKISKALKGRKIETVYEKNCKECCKEFHTHGSTACYCSDTCRKAAAKKRTGKAIRLCEECSEEFRTKNRARKFCSRVCYRESTKPLCKFCNKKFLHNSSKSPARRTFCSDQCYTVAIFTVEKECASCSTKFKITPSQTKSVFCSPDCAENGHRKSCSCGKIFWGYKQQKFCSKSCYLASSAHANRRVTIEYVSEYAGETLLDSSWELEVAKQLDFHKFSWICTNRGGHPQHTFNYRDDQNKSHKYYPDFYVKDLNLYLDPKGRIDSKAEMKISAVRKQNNIDLLIIDEKLYKAFVETDNLDDLLTNWEIVEQVI